MRHTFQQHGEELRCSVCGLQVKGESPEQLRRAAERMDDCIAAAGDTPPIVYRRGPGDCLHDILKQRFGASATAGCKCRLWIRKMNRWGPAGCRANLTKIAARIHKKARKAGGWRGFEAHIPGARLIVRRIVMEAIEMSEATAVAATQEPIDVVYPLGTGSRWNDGELRFSLRSLEKNFPQLGRVFVVGHKPAWLTGVEHIPHPDRFRSNKDANLIEKVLAACKAGVSQRFVRLSDDQLFLRPVRYEDMKPLHLGSLVDRRDGFWASKWKQHLKNTRDALLAAGYGAVHFDSHCPSPYERDSFVAVTERLPFRHVPFTINTLYFNAAVIPGRKLGREKVTFEHPEHNPQRIQERLAGRLYLGYNDAGLTDAMKTVLEHLFPTPSRFELPAEAIPVPVAVAITPPAVEEISWDRFVTMEDLARHSRELAARVPYDCDAVVGAARSGLLPATTIATTRHLPLFISTGTGIVDAGHGSRLPNLKKEPTKIIVVEDTASSGKAIRRAAAQAKARWPAARIISTAVYASRKGATACDFIQCLYARPHFLEWNFPNAWIHAEAAFDMDGIICEDCPPEADDDGPRYRAWMDGVRPKYLPLKFPARLIVTARLERYRDLTETWLRRHGVRWERLVMGPWPDLRSRRGQVARYKAEHFAASRCYLFVESDPRQAREIVAKSGRPVLCPAARQLFTPPGYAWARMRKELRGVAPSRTVTIEAPAMDEQSQSPAEERAALIRRRLLEVAR